MRAVTYPAHMLRASLDDALEVVALTDDRAQALVARALRAITAPDPDVVELVDCLRACCAYNTELRDIGKRLAGHLEEMQRYAARPARVKELAAELRPHLAVMARPSGDPTAYLRAFRALRDLAAHVPFDQLDGRAMRSALGPGRHALLMNIVRHQAAPQLTQHTVPNGGTPTLGRAGGGVHASAVPPEGVGSVTSSLEVAV